MFSLFLLKKVYLYVIISWVRSQITRRNFIMKTTKRILSSVLALVMLLSVCSTGFSVSAVTPNGVVLDEVKMEPVTRNSDKSC